MPSVLSRILAACVVVLSAVGVARADTTWASTATKALSLRNATALGPMPADMPVKIAVAVQGRNIGQLGAFAKSVSTPGNPAFGRYLTSAQYLQTYAPTAAQAQQVADYLKSKGFKQVTILPNRLLVTARGTASMASAAFHPSLSMFPQFGRTVYANTTDAQVPSSLSGIATAVLGLNNFKMQHFIGPPGVPPTIFSRGYGPADFQKAYGADGTPDGGKTTIAIFTAGNVSKVPNDLRNFENEFGLPHVPVQVIPNRLGVAPDP